jgi:hypothetical protein
MVLNLEKSSFKGIKQTTKKGPIQKIESFIINNLEYNNKEGSGHYLKAALNRDAIIMLTLRLVT